MNRRIDPVCLATWAGVLLFWPIVTLIAIFVL